MSACEWPEHWPAHGSYRACGEGDCTRCAMEQEHCESHEGEPCPWEPPRQVQPEPAKVEFVIIGDWLCESSDECTCGSGGYSQHEQYCGVQNIIQVDRLLDEHEAFRTALERAREVARVHPHADTCATELSPSAGYACSCWRGDLIIALTQVTS